MIQAKTEIDILNKINDKDDSDDSNIVRLLDHFMYRNHQCLVFEILSFNLYELLKNTKYAFFCPLFILLAPITLTCCVLFSVLCFVFSDSVAFL